MVLGRSTFTHRLRQGRIHTYKDATPLNALSSMTVVVLAAGVLAGCGGLSPTAPGAGRAHASVQGVPDFSQVRVRYTDGFLQVEARASVPWSSAPFDAERPGGWCFQIFVDADQRSTGYARGFDYLVRAIEATPAGGADLRHTEGGGGPGGWGERVGRIAMQTEEGAIHCAIPLELLGPDDGRVDYVLEIYRTVALPGSGGTRVAHEFVANYHGTSVPFGAQDGAVRRGMIAVAPDAGRPAAGW
jgi:hypothetical protein